MKDIFCFIDEIPVGIGVGTVDGEILYCNKTMQQLLEYTLQELQDNGVESLYHEPDDRQTILRELKKKNCLRDYAVQFRKKSGEVFHAYMDIRACELNGISLLMTVVRPCMQCPDQPQDMHLCSPAEQEIIAQICCGKTNKEIACTMNISTATVESHRKNIRKKLGLCNTKTNLRAYLQRFFPSRPS